MPKPRYKTNNWKQYNQALINHGSLTFWIDEDAISEWKQGKQNKRGRPRVFSDLAITTALMVKRISSMPLRASQGFMDSVFQLAQLPLRCPHYSCISRRAKDVNVSFKTKRFSTLLSMLLASRFMVRVSGKSKNMARMVNAECGENYISQ